MYTMKTNLFATGIMKNKNIRERFQKKIFQTSTCYYLKVKIYQCYVTLTGEAPLLEVSRIYVTCYFGTVSCRAQN